MVDYVMFFGILSGGKLVVQEPVSLLFKSRILINIRTGYGDIVISFFRVRFLSFFYVYDSCMRLTGS